MGISSCKTLEDMIATAREREIDMEMEKNRKSYQVQGFEGSSKRPKVFDSRSRGQHGWGRFGKCNKSHDGACRGGGLGCY